MKIAYGIAAVLYILLFLGNLMASFSTDNRFVWLNVIACVIMSINYKIVYRALLGRNIITGE